MKVCVHWLLFALAVISCLADPYEADKAEIQRLLDQKRYADLQAYATAAAKHQPPFYGGRPILAKVYQHLSELDDKEPNRVWEEHIAKIEAWSAKYPSSIIPRIVLASAWIHYAWKERGGGWANSVSKPAWKVFADRLAKARQILESAEKLPEKDPELYNCLLRVAIGQGWNRPDMEAAFNKGIRLNPNYLSLYETKARYLLPRWYGRPGDWEAFAAQAADARGGEDGDLLYLVIACSQAWTEEEDFFKNTDFSYQRMQRGLEASLRRSPYKRAATNSYARFACFANDRPTAKRLFQSMGPTWETNCWEDRKTFVRWNNWALESGVRIVGNPPAQPRGKGQPSELFAKLSGLGSLGILKWCAGGLILGLIGFIIHRSCSRRPDDRNYFD